MDFYNLIKIKKNSFSVISNLYDLSLQFTNEGEDFISNGDTGCPLGYFEYL